MSNSADSELIALMGRCFWDPLRFVRTAFPWGVPGTELEHEDGPDEWQVEFLRSVGQQVRANSFDGTHAVTPIKEAIASGHDIGKTTVQAWLVLWIMSTRPNCIGTVTANTYKQLTTKTWPAVQRWERMCITAHWFGIDDEKMYALENREGWFCELQSSKASNSEAFAGQHAKSSCSFYIFDEASAVPDIIYEVAEGGLLDGEPMLFMFGNPTRNTGKLYRAVFGSEKERFRHRSIDSRNTKIANKKVIAEWEEFYGEDSDFFRVRVKGLPPRASELQYIDTGRVDDAKTRVVSPLEDEPLICGFDVSGGGSAWNVFRFRRGPDGRSIPAIRLPGEVARDRPRLVALAAELLSDKRPDRKIAYMFVDSAFGSPIVERLHTLGFRNVEEINFGGTSPDSHQSNHRAFMYDRAKEWLLTGGINDDELAEQLTVPGYHINKRNQLVIESKESITKRGESSPDDADAFVLTFARPVLPKPIHDNYKEPEQMNYTAWS